MNTNLSPSGTPTADERTWGLFAHLSALAAFVVPVAGGIIGPLVVWLVKREESAFVGDNAKEALNFNITIMIAAAISWILVWILIGFLLLAIVGVYWLVLTIVAGMKAQEGVVYRYPWSLRLVK